jgi:hypothetical protein
MYGRIRYIQGADLRDVPKNTEMQINLNGRTIKYKLKNTGLYELYVPENGTYVVACTIDGKTYAGSLRSVDSPHEQNLRLKERKD